MAHPNGGNYGDSNGTGS
jgi:hypothetical protein